jgi:hypothetical protein
MSKNRGHNKLCIVANMQNIIFRYFSLGPPAIGQKTRNVPPPQLGETLKRPSKMTPKTLKNPIFSEKHEKMPFLALFHSFLTSLFMHFHATLQY